MKAVLTALALACAALAVPAVAPVHAAPAAATLPAPSRMVLDNSTRVIAALEKRRPEFNRNPAALRSFISSEFSQMFDKDYAARQVLGRHARGATDADVANFADALTNNLMQRYGSSLLAFNTRLTPRVKSQSDLPRGLGVKVSSELVRSGGEPIPIDYLMRQSGGSWKVFDVIVEGVSFVQVFRAQFDAELQNKTIAQVAQELRNGSLQAYAGH